MVLGAKGASGTKKARVRRINLLSLSGRPLGSFHNGMSRVKLTSCGIQWLAQVARYFAQAHLYWKGTNWFTSVLPLMISLSAAFTRRPLGGADVVAEEAGVKATEAKGGKGGLRSQTKIEGKKKSRQNEVT